MKQPKIGVQIMMLKKVFEEIGPYEALKKMAEMGYTCGELSQVPMDKESVLEMKRACEDFQIEIASISGGIDLSETPKQDALNTNIDKYIEDCKTLNCSYIRMGILPFSALESKEKIVEFSLEAEKVALKLLENGIHLYYHNHHFELQKMEGQNLLEIMEEHAPHLGFELDVHWLQRGGVNPIEVIKQFNGKLDLLHLKDYRIKRASKETCEQTDWNGFKDYFDNCIEFAEFGEGNLDMPAIISAGIESGAKYLLIEQDNTYDRTPFESLEITANNLKKMGYSNFF